MEAKQGNAHQELVVMKFGGTSVEDAAGIRRVMAIVRTRLSAQLVVVVSALARVTDQLLQAGQDAASGHLGGALSALRDLYVRHEKLADDLGGVELQVAADRELRGVFQEAEALLQQIAQRGRLTPEWQDHLLGFGERFSSQLVNAALQRAGIESEHVDARSCIVTDKRHGAATPLPELTNDRLQQLVRPLLESGRVVIMGGFIAATADGIPTTLGRGGSDFSAATVGAGLGANRIEIWTDVDGIMTTDPKLCPDARVIPQMSFHEASALAHFGAKVLHPSTLSPAMRRNIPVYVLNSRSPQSSGTEITSNRNPGAGIKAITTKANVVLVDLEPLDRLRCDLLHDVSRVFNQHGCAIDVLASSQSRVLLVAASSAGLSSVLCHLQQVADVRWENHKALVCVVGEGLGKKPEVARRILAAVSDLEVGMIGQIADERTISFLVEESEADEAVRRLHQLLFPPEEPIADWGGDSGAFCQAGSVLPVHASNLATDAARGESAAGSMTCSPHSVLENPGHRPPRASSPGRTARVQWVQPMLG